MTVVLRGLGSVILPALNTALEKTISLFQDLDRTRAERFLQDLRDMDEVDPSVIQQLEATVDIQKAEERLDELREQVQEETVTIGVDFSGAKPETVREDLQDVTVEQLQLQLSSVNEAIQERATRIAELESQESELSQTQKNALDRAERRAEALRNARMELLEGISTLSQFQAAQERVTESRERLDEALSGEAESAAEDQAPSGDSGPTLLQRLSSIENVDELDPATQKAIGDWVEALQSNLEGELKAMQEAAGAQDVGLLGVDVEEMVSRIEDQRKRLEQGEINPAQFAKEAGTIAKEYRKKIETIIDRAVELTTLTEKQGKRMKRGLGVARDEAQALRADFIQTIGDLRGRGEIGQDAALEITKAIKQADDQTLKTAGSLDELLKRLKQTGEAGPDAINAVRNAIEEGTEQTEDFGKALQDTARFVRGIGDLAGQFGDLSDEAEAAIDSTATLLSNVGRLIELKNQKEGFSNIFSSFSGAVSGIGAILGAAGGLVSLLSASGGDGQPQKEMEELRKKIDENVRALKENTEAVLEQARVGENISRRTLDRANELISQIVSSEFDDMSSLQQDRLLTQLENLAPMFENVPDLLENVEEYFMGGQPISDSGQIVVSDQYMRQLAREFVLTDATAQDIVDRLDEKTAGISTSGGLTKEELLNQFGNFSGIGGRLAEIEEQFAQFSDTMSGVIEELNFRRQELGSSFEQLRSTLTDRLPDLGFAENLIGQKAPKTFAEILQSRMEEATRGDLEEIRQKLAESLAGDRDLSFLWQELEGVSVDELLGGVTPSQFEDFLDQLETITEVSRDESDTDFSTSATVQRTITEHQANQLLAFQRELVQLSRTQRDLLSTILASLGGEPPESPPVSESSSAPEAPPASEAPSGPGVGIPADLQETIAAAEANGFQVPNLTSPQRTVNKTVSQGDQTVYNIRIDVDSPDGREIARRIDRAIRRATPGRRQQ
jgi:DNA repair exonuclease SbcCD ATPase subunit